VGSRGDGRVSVLYRAQAREFEGMIVRHLCTPTYASLRSRTYRASYVWIAILLPNGRWVGDSFL